MLFQRISMKHLIITPESDYSLTIKGFSSTDIDTILALLFEAYDHEIFGEDVRDLRERFKNAMTKTQ